MGRTTTASDPHFVRYRMIAARLSGNGVAMPAERTDRRVRRTQQAIRTAFESLIEEKGYDAVTIQDILDRADVGRSTFYAHYRDKEDLLLKGFDDIRAGLTPGSRWPEPTVRARSELLSPILAVAQHVGAYRHTWKPLVLKGGADVVVGILRDTAENAIRDHLIERFGRSPDIPIEPATQFLTGALMGLLTWWLDSGDPATADEVYDIFTRLARPGLKRYLSERRS